MDPPQVAGGRQNGLERRRHPSSGLQVSYRKALEVLARRLGPVVPPDVLEAVLREALPDRQRARLP